MNNAPRCEYSPVPGSEEHRCTSPACFILFEDLTHICRLVCVEHLMLVVRQETELYPLLVFWLHPLLPHMMVGLRHGQPPWTNRGVKPPEIGVRNA